MDNFTGAIIGGIRFWSTHVCQYLFTAISNDFEILTEDNRTAMHFRCVITPKTIEVFSETDEEKTTVRDSLLRPNFPF